MTRADMEVSAPQLLFISKRLAPESYDGLAMLMQVCLYALHLQSDRKGGGGLDLKTAACLCAGHGVSVAARQPARSA